ncbi:Cohesin subunit SA-3 [Rhynchospora pubera]|uniref:Cohesin subunit SA-3 n=1 Tax=Rhynchospora pubera TaxID=906938 RepID=A0AAV8EEC6_9POAL|nr:Cohesin subunit SA-3 [Rhynchospora pubera]
MEQATVPSETSTRRSKRGRVLEQEGAEPSKSTRSPDDLFNDDDNDFVLKTKRKRGAAARTAGWSDDQPLIDAIKHNRKVISLAVKKWVEKYEADPKSALIDLLMMLFEACGAKYRLDLEIIDDVSVDDVLMSLVDLARNGLVEDYYNSKQKELKNFKDNLGAFWEDLVLECQEGPLFDKAVFEKCVDYVIVLSCTPPRVYRQVTTLVGLQIVTTYISVGKTLIQQRETTQRQLNAEKKKGNDGSRMESLNRRLKVTHERITALEKMMRKVLTGLFMHRYRDIEPEIRMSCIKALGVWIVDYPSRFLQDSYLKYLGWALNDKNALVRKTSVLALQGIYKIDDNIPSLSLFTDYFSKRILQMADDIDISVAVSAIGLLKLLLRHQLLTDNELVSLYDLLKYEPPMIRHSDGEPSEVHIGWLLQNPREFCDDPVLSAYVIDGIWDDMKAVKASKCIISILNNDELPDINGRVTKLVWLLNASAKKAVGYRIVPVIDNRKQYLSNAQKEALENNRKELTSAMLKSYPQLLHKYVADKAKVSPLVDMLPLLKLEMYSLKRQQQNFKAVVDLISDAFFKHSEKATLRSCIKAIIFCSIEGPADLQEYVQSKLNDLESELVSKLKNAMEKNSKNLVKKLKAGDDEYSLLVNLKRLYELQMAKPVSSEGLFEDMTGILGSLPEMENEMKSFLLLDMYLSVVWSLHAMDGENPDEASMEALLRKRNTLLRLLYSFIETLLDAQSEGRCISVLSCRVCIITAEIWCYFKNDKFFSTKLQCLGYAADLPVVQNFWKLCEGHLISDETKDKEANQEYIEETNKDTVMIAAAKLVATNTIPKGYLGPEIISHFTLHSAIITQIIMHLIASLKKTSTEEIPFLFLEALKLAYRRYLTSIDRGNQLEIGRSLSDCKELASRLSGTFEGAAITKSKLEIIKMVKDGIEFAFSDAPGLLTFLELALVPFVSKLSSADILDVLKDVEAKTENVNMNENPTAWNPCSNFVAFLHDKYAKNETTPGVEEQPVRRRGRPQKVRVAPPAKKLFEEPGA